MSKYYAVVIFLLLVVRCIGGVVIVVENDVWRDNDDSYTHGMAVGYYSGVYEVGVRTRIYTPRDISIVSNQPGDRPWCGVSGIYLDKLRREIGSWYRCGVEVGVLGMSSLAEEQQVLFHRLIGSREPKGWGNQMRDELALNGYCSYGGEVMRGLWGIMRIGYNIGGVLGTTYCGVWDNIIVAVGYFSDGFFAGGDEGVMIKGARGARGNSAYIYASGGYRYVWHNATLGSSIFHEYDEEHRVDLENNVGEGKVGVRVVYNKLVVGFGVVVRSDEYVGQESRTDWGRIEIGYDINW